ncbi:MAG: hypothetical protein FWC01_04865 [Treponema sp.]|nr:hypothetical protein [Treponema sp.]
MTITQTVEIPAEGRRTIDVPSEVPAGKVILTFTPVSESTKYTAMSKEELINKIGGSHGIRDKNLLDMSVNAHIFLG